MTNSDDNQQPYEIRDQDLLDQLEKAKGSPILRIMQSRLEQVQKKRDENTARRSALTPVQRRRDEIRQELEENTLADQDRYHIHSVLALCGLPYRRPADELADYVREYGRNSLVVQSGYLKDPVSGKMEKQGLPYGPKARLLMLHVCTMALRQNSHEIEIEDSMSAFIQELGFPVTGGKRGTITQFKEQLNRLAASRMQIGLWDGNRSLTINSQPIEAFDVWLPRNTKQRMLWSSKLYLDRKFFESLKQHALPVDIRALRGFTQSARQIDMLLWLSYRIHGLKKPYLITWELLQDQFGAEVKSRSRKFKQAFKEDLDAIQEVYPKIPAVLGEKGLRLHPADPEKLFVPPKRLGKP